MTPLTSLRLAVLLGFLVPMADVAALAAGPAQRTLDTWARSKALAGTTVGVDVRCTSDGATWGHLNADARLVPASGAKLLTTAAVLDTFPLTTTWDTTLHAALDDAGVARGDLVLVGRGDPQLMPDDLVRLAEGAFAAGLRLVDGDLVVNTGLFGGPLLPPAFDLKDTDASYRPAVSAAGSNYGAVRVVVKPGRTVGAPPIVRVDPASDGVIARNDAATMAGKGSNALEIFASTGTDGRTRISVTGSIGVKAAPVAVRKRVADPGLLTAYTLRAFLEARGVRITGSVRVDTAAATSDDPVLATVSSPSLALALHDMNTWSNNSMAETFFLQLGRGPEGLPATWERAQAKVAETLVARGVSRESFQIINGSGLYAATSVSARAMTTLLASFAGDDEKSVAFRESLAVAGAPGTLEWRLRTPATRGLVRAKTGTLDEVTSISGYVPAASGCVLAFAIFINEGRPDRTDALRREVDKLILALARL